MSQNDLGAPCCVVSPKLFSNTCIFIELILIYYLVHYYLSSRNIQIINERGHHVHQGRTVHHVLSLKNKFWGMGVGEFFLSM